ncbi:hypothetical protein [Burkholderia ubonensis]|uniref:hypothetical protein n=1 Tax=Burkholderia ubonensis TaxID=101571 RepID=UPI0012FB7E4A|nr:hypothetical protein [Burkholderia ubonensis]
MAITIEQRFQMAETNANSQNNLDAAAVAAVLLFEKISDQLYRRKSVDEDRVVEVAAQLAAGAIAGSGPK